MRVVVEEREAVALAGGVVVAEHGIAQAAGLAHDRHGAVAQRDHLGQAARLKQRRHQEHVRAGIDAVRQLVVHLEARGHASRIGRLGPLEQIGVLGVAHAQHDQLEAGIHQLADDALDQVQALLVRQARDHADDRRIGVDGQAQLALQALLTVLLAAQRERAVVGVDHGILFRVVVVHVDAVENATQMAAARAQQALEPLAVIGGLDLLGVAGADGGDLIRIDQAGLQVVRAAVALELVGGEQAVAQAQGVLHVLDAEDALVLQVVDGEGRAHLAVEGEVAVLDIEQRGDHAGLPVVAVDDVRLEAQVRQRVDDCAAEVAVALVLVAAHAVDVGAAEVVLIVHEVERDALIDQGLDAAVLVTPAQLDLKLALILHLLAEGIGDGAVQRQDDAHVDALALQHGGQGARHVGQAAGLDKGDAFGSGKKNSHDAQFSSLTILLYANGARRKRDTILLPGRNFLFLGRRGMQKRGCRRLQPPRGQMTTSLAMTMGYASGPIRRPFRRMIACLSRMQWSISAPS